MPQHPENKYEVWTSGDLFSDVKILEINRTEATIVNEDNWKVDEEHELKLAFDDVDVKVKCIVTAVKEDIATIEFLDMPASIANKLSYHYMKTAAN